MFVMLKMLFDTCLDICQLVLTVSATVCVAAGAVFVVKMLLKVLRINT